MRGLFHLWLVGLGYLPCVFATPDMGADALIDIPLEELMQMDAVVTSASKREEVLKDTPSAIFVITREDIRRSGVSNVPDALRMVPGVQVARITASEWAVSARGLGGRYSRYLLVLVDGRSQYSSLFSGVNWDELNVSLENIERIEVIRGPGGTLWGANAVNGVVNIITRRADAQTGLQFRAQVGDGEENGSLYVGGQHTLTDSTAWRLSGHVQSLAGLDASHATAENKDWQNARIDTGVVTRIGAMEINLKAGWLAIDATVPWAKQSLTPPGTVAIQGEESKQGYYLALYGTLPTASGSWDWRLSNDDTQRDSSVFQWDTRNTDVELRWSGVLAGQHQLTAGVYARYTTSYFMPEPGGLDVRLSPPEQKGNTSSIFFQDTWTVNDALLMTLGMRYDSNSLTDSSLQPSARGMWRIDDSQRVWLAVSRAVSTPNRVLNNESELDILTLPPTPPTNLPSRVSLVSDGSEVADVELTAWEAGYRWVMTEQVNLDLALYHHQYENILGASELGMPELRFEDTQPYLHLPVYTTGELQQQSDGVEWSVQYQPAETLFLQYSGSYSRVDLPESPSLIGDNLELGSSVPDWQHSLRSLWNPMEHWQVDVWLRHVAAFSGIDAYTSVDARLEYKFNRQATVSLITRNLGRPVTIETTREIFNTGDYGVTPSVSLKLEWLLK